MQYESPQCEFPPHHSKPFLPTLWGYDVCRKIRQHYEESRTVAWRISSKDIGPSIQSLSPKIGTIVFNPGMAHEEKACHVTTMHEYDKRNPYQLVLVILVALGGIG